MIKTVYKDRVLASVIGPKLQELLNQLPNSATEISHQIIPTHFNASYAQQFYTITVVYKDNS